MNREGGGVIKKKPKQNDLGVLSSKKRRKEIESREKQKTSIQGGSGDIKTDRGASRKIPFGGEEGSIKKTVK